MIVPAQKDDAFLADVAAADDRDGFSLWWLGQSGFLLKHAGRHMLLDPYLSDSLTRKYADSPTPHERMTEIVIDPARLDFIDVVTSSHNHTDHLDAETLGPILTASPDVQVVVAEANRSFVAQRLGIAPDRPVGLDDGAQAEVAGFHLHGIPAAHETVERDKQSRCRFLGYVIRMGRWTVFHAGDTVLYDGLVERLMPLEIDVALLPINGRSPDRGVLGNLSGTEAAELARLIGAKLAIPCHYDMFRFNTATPDVFVETCKRIGQPCRVLKCGQRFRSCELVWP
ncbi:MAG TPA: MBL fold metallo-hydrolase [Thermoguttaceae bacterium]|nr:MBL fold metallo-hydrolase [Thermoguttaceae bacterium]